MCTENFASLLGQPGPNDLVRKFRIGPLVDNHPDAKEPAFGGEGEEEQQQQQQQQRNVVGPSAAEHSPLLRPNVWPSSDSWSHEAASSFRSHVESYYQVSCTAAHAIVRAVCDGIRADRPDLAESVRVLSSVNETAYSGSTGPCHTSILTLLGYRTGTRHKRMQKEPLVAPHTDVGVITMLLHDNGNCAVLQRAGRGGSGSGSGSGTNWVDVTLPSVMPDDDPVFIINIGDCTSELSHGSLPSTVHRVVPRLGTVPRNCLALFVGLDPQEVLHLPSGDRVSYEEWRKARIAKAQQSLWKHTK
jgi:isopenicillin N synthase-like dioxygenase